MGRTVRVGRGRVVWLMTGISGRGNAMTSAAMVIARAQRTRLYQRARGVRIDPRVEMWAGIVLTALLLALVCWRLRGIGIATFAPLASAGLLFWCVFAMDYLHGPIGDWIVFRRLWGVGPKAIVPMIRKLVLNALFVSYSGDALVLAWAKRRGDTAAHAFAVVKDTAILSALAGSTVTVVLTLMSLHPLAYALGMTPGTLLLSVSLLTAFPVLAVCLRNAVLHLPARDLVFAYGVHLARTSANVGLQGAMWYLLLPSAPLGTWVMLSAARMVVSRLPMIPNKDIALAAVAMMLFPAQLQMAGIVMVTGTLITVAHMIVWVALKLAERSSRRATTGGALAIA